MENETESLRITEKTFENIPKKSNDNKDLVIPLERLKLKQFQCKRCKKFFSEKEHLDRHVDKFHLKKANTIICNQCGSTFFDQSAMQKHINAVHLKLKPFQCEKCKKCFSIKQVLEKHVDMIHLNKATKLTCDECDSTFFDNSTLKRHMKSVHLKLKPFHREY